MADERATKETRACEVCGRPKVQQFPDDPKRDWYWYCPADGWFSHVVDKERIRAAREGTP